ncbi:MAG: S1C family serine protease [Nitrososphaeraceae archaeon]
MQCKNSTVFTILAIAIALIALTIPASVIAPQSDSLSPQYPSLNTIFKVEKSVVQVTSKIPVNNTMNSQTRNATALGSGFLYDKQGHIITNAHVVGEAKIVDVTFVDGSRYTAKVVGTDIYSDLAAVQIIDNATQRLKPLVIGNSSKLEVGDPVIAIGNPFGLSDTMTIGIVSQGGRLLPSSAGLGFSIPDTIQTDAQINPGNSGGPLLNIQGQVIGINTAAISASAQGGFSGVGLAIPSTTVLRIVPTLIEKGYYTHPYVGLTLITLTSDLAQTINGSLPTNFKGVYVDLIKKDGPADKAGIHGSTIDQYSMKHGGDIIIAVDGHTVTRSEDLISYIDDHKSVGDSVIFTVHRNGHALNLKTTLSTRPSPLQYLSLMPSQPPP